ncbi:hypothetical protein [Halosimplex pelagicum]|uniref:Uncharacterized protein n=1 Tax=Halosimplex pelagicum TaxID=869886 RepID=A0A7D5TBS5_9EURY|nr:hypothetical protein [Halosimplex pelagicum]QLH82309.1 hypothetical protein HZS54_12100 [Halosimplex pelagicum]
MSMRDPEAVAHARESAEWGEFEVVIEKDGEEMGRLDETFSNDFDATRAAKNARIPDVGIDATVVDIES